MNISYHRHFIKTYKKLPHPLRREVDNTITLFKQYPYQKELNNHKLHGKWEGYRSINITGNYRAIFEISDLRNVTFAIVGTHHQLYGS